MIRVIRVSGLTVNEAEARASLFIRYPNGLEKKELTFLYSSLCSYKPTHTDLVLLVRFQSPFAATHYTFHNYYFGSNYAKLTEILRKMLVSR